VILTVFLSGGFYLFVFGQDSWHSSGSKIGCIISLDMWTFSTGGVKYDHNIPDHCNSNRVGCCSVGINGITINPILDWSWSLMAYGQVSRAAAKQKYLSDPKNFARYKESLQLSYQKQFETRQNYVPTFSQPAESLRCDCGSLCSDRSAYDIHRYFCSREPQQKPNVLVPKRVQTTLIDQENGGE
jgi:hypothetical protein